VTTNPYKRESVKSERKQYERYYRWKYT